MLQKLTLDNSSISFMGVGVLLETMEQNIHHITDPDLQRSPTGNEAASLLARSFGNNGLPNLTRLVLHNCDVGDDGSIPHALAWVATFLPDDIFRSSVPTPNWCRQIR
jgi:hypothetical protein